MSFTPKHEAIFVRRRLWYGTTGYADLSISKDNHLKQTISPRKALAETSFCIHPSCVARADRQSLTHLLVFTMQSLSL